jgi:hypothetical protein
MGEREQIRGSERSGGAYLGQAPMLPVPVEPGMAATGGLPCSSPRACHKGELVGGAQGTRLSVRYPLCRYAADAAVDV